MRASYKILICSFIISFIVAILVFKYTALYEIMGFDKALEGILLFSSISVGFYGACVSVIASIFNTKVIKDIMSDKKDKREFIIVVCSALLSGFLTVFTSIIYRVLLVDPDTKLQYFKTISMIWSGFTLMFISMNFLFIFVSFLIYFNNKEEPSAASNVFDPNRREN
ncbi:hypothetical protein ACQKII_06955 [Lysinibacillus sp. NPDC048646]|uniref:hypothetical protein n=1 Tax=Lysinibacillus sp. NPDC048646 TaxID=3390574 RepID=UPI003D040971